MDRACATCDKPLNRRNRYGYCQPCSARRTMQSVNARGLNVRPEDIARRARTDSARKLSWCPPYLRPAYLAILQKHTRAEEARRIILAQYDADLRRQARRAA